MAVRERLPGTVDTSLSETDLARGSGLIPIGPGGGGFHISDKVNASNSPHARTIPDWIADAGLNVKGFGAIGDGGLHPLSERYNSLARAQAVYPFATSLAQQIDWAAVQLALNTAAELKISQVVIPGGLYDFGGETAYISSFTPMNGIGPDVAPAVRGAGKTHTVIKVDNRYAFTVAEEAHFVRISGVQVLTTTGGFLHISNTYGVCGVELHDDYLNGCGTGFWALFAPGASQFLFPVTITDSHFRHIGNEYKGGVVYCTNSLGFTMGAGNFITRQTKDGPIIHLKNATAAHIGHFQMEGTAGNGGAPPSTNQAMILLDGNCFDITIETIWLEGCWDYFVLIASAAVVLDLKIKSVFAWQYAEGQGGKPSVSVLDMLGGPNSRRVRIEGFVYKNDNTVAGTGYIINDPTHGTYIQGFENQSSTSIQQLRLLSQRYRAPDAGGAAKSTALPGVREMETVVGGCTNPDAGAGGASFFRINLANHPDSIGDDTNYEGGMYEVSFFIASADKLHKVARVCRVIYDRAVAPHNFASVQTIGTDVTKNSAPTIGVVSVDRNGVLGINYTQAVAQPHSIYWSWKRTAPLSLNF